MNIQRALSPTPLGAAIGRRGASAEQRTGLLFRGVSALRPGQLSDYFSADRNAIQPGSASPCVAGWKLPSPSLVSSSVPSQ